ncbi:MAG: carboxypeptidase-like regulatory domain-containing protein, partial [Pyrinomonadaceae bacterium]
MSQRTSIRKYLLSIAAVLSFAAIAEGQTYGGEAAAVKVTVTVPATPVLTTSVADTGNLPAAGGNILLTSAGVTIPNILGISDATVRTSGGPGAVPPTPNSSQSLASVNALSVGIDAGPVPDLLIGANVVRSDTFCSCPTRSCTGTSTLTNLSITDPDGNNTFLSGTVNPAPNTTINIFAGGIIIGTVVLNEQIASPGSITVNAIHVRLVVAGIVTDVIVASAHSDITCAIAPLNNFYSGRATGIRNRNRTLLGTDITTLVSDTGFLPTTGGQINVSTVGATLPVLPLTSGTITSNTGAGGSTVPLTNASSSASDSTVEALALNVADILPFGPPLLSVTATTVTSNTRCTCSLSLPTCTGDSDIVDLEVRVLGALIAVDLDFPPNQTIVLPLGLGSITFNEQVVLPPSPSIHPENITVNAIHLRLNVLGLALSDTIVASSHSDIDCAVAPSAADVSLSGRVLDLNGRAISRAVVSAMDSTGKTHSSMSNTFGYYSIKELDSGDLYVVSASAKGHTFSPRTISLTDSVTGFDILPDPRQKGKVAPPAGSDPPVKLVKEASPTRRPETVVYSRGSAFDSELTSS